MRKLFLVPVIGSLAALGFVGQAEARPGGCIKDAIVGGIAGHFVGHGGMGAAAGCAYGMHERIANKSTGRVRNSVTWTSRADKEARESALASVDGVRFAPPSKNGWDRRPEDICPCDC